MADRTDIADAPPRSADIVIPTRDRPELLRRAVRSALDELPAKGRVIVVDDGGAAPAALTLADLAGDRLTVLLNTGRSGGGGSPSRNRGVAASSADVVFFLDDDDRFVPGYVARVLGALTAEARAARFGFAARRFEPSGAAARPERRALPEGPIRRDGRFSDFAFPFSAGFWVRRDTFDRIGPLAETLQTNSDTEYACRLWTSGLDGWYSARPGTIIEDGGARGPGQLGNVTARTKSTARAQAFRDIVTRYEDAMRRDPDLAEFLLWRLIRHGFRGGVAPGLGFVRRHAASPATRVRLSAYWIAMRARHGRRAVSERDA